MSANNIRQLQQIDNALIPPELSEILDRVRYAADRMPDNQLYVSLRPSPFL